MLGLGLRQELRERLTLGYRLQLKQLLSLSQELRHPEYPLMAKGLDGMGVADRVLRGYNASGILIGGLSEAVWNRRRKPEELTKHKDVDVLVLNEDADIGRFEEGIDWWLPQRGEIPVDLERGIYTGIKWYENANGIVLSFGTKKYRNLMEFTPGLYIPGSEWVIDMREAEVMANVDERVEIEDGVQEGFRDKMRKKIKTRLPKFISNEFKGRILSNLYGCVDEGCIGVRPFTLDDLRALGKTA